MSLHVILKKLVVIALVPLVIAISIPITIFYFPLHIVAIIEKMFGLRSEREILEERVKVFTDHVDFDDRCEQIRNWIYK